MTPGQYKLTLYRHSDFEKIFSFKRPIWLVEGVEQPLPATWTPCQNVPAATWVPLDLTGMEPFLQIRSHAEEPDPPLLEANTANDWLTVQKPDTNGILLMAVPAAAIKLLPDHEMVYDLKFRTLKGISPPLLQGPVEVIDTVTRISTTP